MIEIINIKDGLNEYLPIQEKELTKEHKKYLENFLYWLIMVIFHLDDMKTCPMNILTGI